MLAALVHADHCSLNEGDAYCAELFPERPLCNSPLRTDECDIGALGLDVAKYGCVSEEELLCHDPVGTTRMRGIELEWRDGGDDA